MTYACQKQTPASHCKADAAQALPIEKVDQPVEGDQWRQLTPYAFSQTELRKSGPFGTV
jgi:hypothetical protein